MKIKKKYEIDFEIKESLLETKIKVTYLYRSVVLSHAWLIMKL